jgi:hypothetical protein
MVYIEFFASRRADITSMRSVLPVNFWISGSYNITVSSISPNTKRWITITHIKSHENIVFLHIGSAWCHRHFESVPDTYLLITNSKLALGLLVLVGESLELLDGFRLQDLDTELDVALGVFVARL